MYEKTVANVAKRIVMDICSIDEIHIVHYILKTYYNSIKPFIRNIIDFNITIERRIRSVNETVCIDMFTVGSIHISLRNCVSSKTIHRLNILYKEVDELANMLDKMVQNGVLSCVHVTIDNVTVPICTELLLNLFDRRYYINIKVIFDKPITIGDEVYSSAPMLEIYTSVERGVFETLVNGLVHGSMFIDVKSCKPVKTNLRINDYIINLLKRYLKQTFDRDVNADELISVAYNHLSRFSVEPIREYYRKLLNYMLHALLTSI